ncbi:MAG: hypothetical protein RL632_2284, partial [Bacteroidota bacterium]
AGFAVCAEVLTFVNYIFQLNVYKCNDYFF